MLNLKNFLRASNSSYIARGYTSNNSNKFSKPVVESLQGDVFAFLLRINPFTVL